MVEEEKRELPLGFKQKGGITRLRGTLERVTFSNEENGFVIGKLRPETARGTITILGELGPVNPGETLELEGEWIFDRRYGEQFRVYSCCISVPATVQGIRRYLGSGLVKGIGPVMSERLTRAFGGKTLEVIEHQPERLLEVEGIGRLRMERIIHAWDDQKAIKDVMVFLHGHGVGPGFAVKIYKAYKKDAVRLLRENPYRLAMEIHGIGFKTADRIARDMGIPKDAPIRAESGIVYVLNTLTEEGHSFLPEGELLERASKVLEVSKEILGKAIEALNQKGRVVVEASEGPEGERNIYLRPFWIAETNVARHLARVISISPEPLVIDAQKAIEWVQRSIGIDLALKQEEAIRKVLEGKMVVITGGPGTGKTTILKGIIQIFEKKQMKVLLAAPTGRAAKRLSEATGREAKTLHRLLEFMPGEQRFKRNAENPLSCDLIVVDEASMIDILLMNSLLKAVPPHARLILVGDSDQLPAVGPGNVLKDLISSGVVEVVTLTEIFRQAKESNIIVNAHRVREGQFPIIRKSTQGSDFFFIERPDPDEALETILTLCKERIPASFGLDPVEEIQVISPMHKGIVGVENLNRELQKLLNPCPEEVSKWGRGFRLMDKVMQIRNDYEKDVFNGDIGRIVKIDHEQQEMVVRIDDRDVTYEFMELEELVPAYAISVHKSQGSEYPAVILPLLPQHYVLLQRNLLYTAISRGKKLVVIVGSKKAIGMAIANDRITKRYTRLASRLRACLNG